MCLSSCQKGKGKELVLYDFVPSYIEIAVVDGGEDNYGGYVITNLLGSMKFIPYMKRLPKGGIHPLHIRKDDGRVLVHKAYSSRLISVPDSRVDRCGLLIGGESAMYRYSFGNVRPDGSPVYSQPSEVLEKNAPLYGGSLTVPNVVDWDGDGVLDIVAGNSEGRLLFFKNNGTNRNPDFAMSEEICAGGKSRGRRRHAGLLNFQFEHRSALPQLIEASGAVRASGCISEFPVQAA